MSFNSASHTNASHSIFSDVQGSQVNVYGPITVYFSSAPFTPSPRLLRKASSDLSRPISNSEVPFTGSLVMISHFPVALAIDATLGDIAQITELLISRRVPTDSHLVPELKLLQQILILNKLAIEAYGDRPLGKSLANRVAPAVERCREVLQELLHGASRTWLSFVSIGDMWGSTWWNKWDEGELALLKRRLCRVRIPLGEMLLALNSVSWVELGNELCSSHASLEIFHKILCTSLPSLGHIQLNSVQVVDHLGRIVPVPIQFCSTWKEFNYIIKGHCRNLPGSRFVDQGDYAVIRTADSQIIRHSEFAVETGMVLEMAIVLRQWTDNLNNKCPRCGHLNLNVIAPNGWIECTGCPAQFQVATVDKNEDNEETYSALGGGKVGEEDSRKNHDESAEARSEENGTRNDQEIVSPASQLRTSKANNDNLQPQDDDGKRFFRRIQVLHQDSTHGTTPTVNSFGDAVEKIFSLHVTGHTFLDSISRQLDGKQYFYVFIVTVFRLPVTPEDIAKQFALDGLVRQKLQTHIESSAKITQRLREHCLDFQEATFKHLISLKRKIKECVKGGKVALPMLFVDIQQLIDASKDGSDTTMILDALKDLIGILKRQSGIVLHAAMDVSVGLRQFCNLMARDLGAAAREMRYLDQQAEEIGQGASGRLTITVKSLKQIAASIPRFNQRCSVEQKQLVWVGLIGLVPQRAVKEQPGKGHFDHMSKLSESKDERDLLERASLTCRMMVSYWEGIHELLKHSRGTIQLIQGLLQVVIADLESIDDFLGVLLETPLPSHFTLPSYTAANERIWSNLEKHAEGLNSGIGDIVEL